MKSLELPEEKLSLLMVDLVGLALDMVERDWHKIDLVAQLLPKHRRLNRQQMIDIMEHDGAAMRPCRRARELIATIRDRASGSPDSRIMNDSQRINFSGSVPGLMTSKSLKSAAA